MKVKNIFLDSSQEKDLCFYLLVRGTASFATSSLISLPLEVPVLTEHYSQRPCWTARTWVSDFFRKKVLLFSPRRSIKGPPAESIGRATFMIHSTSNMGTYAKRSAIPCWEKARQWRVLGVRKRSNPKPWLWRHLAAATWSDGPTAWKESAVWAAAARWRQLPSLGFHSFFTLGLSSGTRWDRTNRVFARSRALKRREAGLAPAMRAAMNGRMCPLRVKGLNIMAAIRFICASLLFRALASTMSQKSPLVSWDQAVIFCEQALIPRQQRVSTERQQLADSTKPDKRCIGKRSHLRAKCLGKTRSCLRLSARNYFVRCEQLCYLIKYLFGRHVSVYVKQCKWIGLAVSLLSGRHFHSSKWKYFGDWHSSLCWCGPWLFTGSVLDKKKDGNGGQSRFRSTALRHFVSSVSCGNEFVLGP